MDRYTKVFLMALTALLAVALYCILAPFWAALAWGICLAVLLAPVQCWASRRLGGRGGVAAAIITGLVPVLFGLPVLSLGLAFVDQVAELSLRLKDLPLLFDGGLLVQLEQMPVVGRIAGFLRLYLSATTEQLQGWLDKGVGALLESLAGSGGDFLLGAMGMFIQFFLMLILLFFLLRDGPVLLARVVRLVPMDARRTGELIKLIGDTIQAVVYGEIVTALVQGALVGIGFAIAGLPSAVVFGVLAAVLSLLPVGGAAIVWVPAVLYLFAVSQPGWAIFLLVWGIGVSVSDNLMRPLLIASRAPVSLLLVFVGVIGGLAAFGMVGMIIGPVVLAVCLALLRHFEATLPASP